MSNQGRRYYFFWIFGPFPLLPEQTLHFGQNEESPGTILLEHRLYKSSVHRISSNLNFSSRYRLGAKVQPRESVAQSTSTGQQEHYCQCGIRKIYFWLTMDGAVGTCVNRYPLVVSINIALLPGHAGGCSEARIQPSSCKEFCTGCPGRINSQVYGIIRRSRSSSLNNSSSWEVFSTV